ncbi:type III-A CRISPR-associated RAMP protein Csm5 [Parabacteroides sp. Marseille-P3160]|uniref:type III-A CRISPR-associated RAMP protein Csm5 n=1 Tax=Parabacteroides sp. Marseille-P3160 TaxID=1917887 RepID=UPI0009BA1C03|nr:type III-A CRISPR-associated RAMP protein Csm5 [Parabacteroides sp. Marseille-P3160]
MSNIKIETLTPVHIGSGETLQYGNDFVKGKEDGSSVLGIIDAGKIMKLIGYENIDRWVTAIERKEFTDKIVKVYAPDTTIEDYAKRTILEWSKVKETDTLKEQIHDGLGRPYIPGSSIKGAIRTAVLASLANDISGIEDKLKDKKGKVNAKTIEAELFGKDPNSDVFRFLQVGDAYFGDNYEVAIRMVNINERRNQSFWDESKSQLIEAIVSGDETTFQLKLNIDSYEKVKSKVHPIPICMSSINSLFQAINKHTQMLVEQEIDYWNDRKTDDDKGKIDLYLENINNILQTIQSCEKGKSCLLRIGHGSGWRFITGAWTESLDNFKNVVVPIARPENDKYVEYSFPKTRRVDDECTLLGFVKLTVLG